MHDDLFSAEIEQLVIMIDVFFFKKKISQTIFLFETPCIAYLDLPTIGEQEIVLILHPRLVSASHVRFCRRKFPPSGGAF